MLTGNRTIFCRFLSVTLSLTALACCLVSVSFSERPPLAPRSGLSYGAACPSSVSFPEELRGTQNGVPAGWLPFSLDNLIEPIGAVSPESRPCNAMGLYSAILSWGRFRFDEKSHLVSTFGGLHVPPAPGYRTDGHAHVAVFDRAQRLLGAAQTSLPGGGRWQVKGRPGERPIPSLFVINLDLGISKTYKEARFFTVTITENPAMVPSLTAL